MLNRRKIIWYHPDLKEQARDLRKNCTIAEKLLWQKIKGKKLRGYDFHRQKPLLYYIVDFYCHELNLVIEIDGETHNNVEVKTRNLIRQGKLEDYGVSFLSFTNEQIIFSIDDVIGCIYDWIVESEKFSKTHQKKRLS